MYYFCVFLQTQTGKNSHIKNHYIGMVSDYVRVDLCILGLRSNQMREVYQVWIISITAVYCPHNLVGKPQYFE